MPTMKEFILEVLAARAAPMTIADIYETFSNQEEFRSKRKPSIRTQLNRLCEEDRI